MLGVPTSSKYADVRAAFLRLAMLHHPDTASLGDGEEGETEVVGIDAVERKENDKKRAKDAAISKFVDLREAFESIVEGEDGMAMRRSDGRSAGGESSRSSGGRRGDGGLMSEEEFEAWFQAETGHAVPYCHSSLRHFDPAVLREVAAVTEGMSPGGLDRGGMWQLAASLRKKAKEGDLPPLRVGSTGGGTGEGSAAKGGRRRRRRR